MNPVVPVQPQPWRIGIACVAFAALFAAVGTRLHRLQIEQADTLARMRSSMYAGSQYTDQEPAHTASGTPLPS